MENNGKEKISKKSDEILKDVLKDEKKKKESEEKKGKEKKKFNVKKLKHSTLSIIFCCVFVAVLVLVNVVATSLFDKYPITIDLTKDKIYSASEEAENYAKKVESDVLVTVFADKDSYESFSEYTKQASELLKNYHKINNHIKYRFIDIDSNPEIARNYESARPFDIVFETSSEVDGKEVKRTRTIPLVDMVNFKSSFTEQISNSGTTIDAIASQYSQQYGDDRTFLYYYKDNIESSNADQAYASALMNVTDPDPKYVTFLTGKNEIAEFAYFKKLLTANGYNVEDIDITSNEIPEHTDVAVVCAPKNDYGDAEIEKLSNFLENDGKLGKQIVYVASISQEDTPKLNEFLSEYGLKIGKGAICETYQGNYYNYPYITTTTEISDNFKKDLQSEEPKIITALSRPVETLFDERDMNSTESYVKSSKNAYTAEISVNSQGLQIGNHLSEGEKNYVAVGSKAKFGENDEDTVYSNIIAVGSEYMLSDSYLSDGSFQNGQYILSVVNGLTNKTKGITISPKTVTGTTFNINELQKNVLKWTFCLILPAAVLVVGIVIWAKRKNR